MQQPAVPRPDLLLLLLLGGLGLLEALTLFGRHFAGQPEKSPPRGSNLRNPFLSLNPHENRASKPNRMKKKKNFSLLLDRMHEGMTHR